MIRPMLMCAALFAASTVAALAVPFTVSSPTFAENTRLPLAAADAKCGGGTSTSPALAWANAPAETKSFAVLVYDPDAFSVPGVSHWVAYGIPASTSLLPAGLGSGPSPLYVAGANIAGDPVFRGLCPPPGTAPHHYIFTVYATDLAPTALAPGLDRNALLTALHGHAIAAASTVGTYSR